MTYSTEVFDNLSMSLDFETSFDTVNYVCYDYSTWCEYFSGARQIVVVQLIWRASNASAV